MKQKKVSIRRRNALKSLTDTRTMEKMNRSVDAPDGVRYGEMTKRELDNRIKKESDFEVAKQVRKSAFKEDRYKLKEQAKQGNKYAKDLSRAKPKTPAQKTEVKEYNKKMAAKRAMTGSERKLKAMASNTAKLRNESSRRGAMGQAMGSWHRGPKVKK